MGGAVVGIAQQKGGAGKTTLVAQLGIALTRMGKRVALIDIDPQGSLSAWHRVRRRWLGEDRDDIEVEAISGWRLGARISSLSRTADLVLIDGPSQTEADTRNAIRHADLVLIPCQPQALDMWATQPILELARQEQKRALLVLNRVPARSRLAQAIRSEISANQWPVAHQTLGNRQAYAASIGIGHGVAEVAPDCAASHEIGTLAAEVLAALH
jgi:chromosome partitioning protein